MTTTLTERYIAQAIKGLPPEMQDDVRAELEASIADAIESELEQGEERGDPERTVLTELGDPGALAAGYIDRPLQLIGPKYYLTWWRLLKLLIWIVIPCVVGAVALGLAISEASFGEIIGQTIAVSVTVFVHLCFWVTLVFAILERAGADTGAEWDVDQLPEPQSTGTGRADLIAALIFLGITVGALLWDSFIGFIRVDGEALSLMNPDLWPAWMALLFVIFAIDVVLAIAIFVKGRWTTAFAVVNTALAVSFASWGLTLLGRGQLVNSEWLDFVFLQNGVGHDVLRILAVLLGFGIAGFSLWSIIDGWLKRRRDARR